MKQVIVSVLVLASGIAQAQVPSALKPGLWETKIIKQILDGKDMSDQMAKVQAAMAKMPPEQRAAMESHMKSIPGTGFTVRTCISPAMAAKYSGGGGADPQGHCPPANLSVSGNKTSFSINCTYDGRTTVGSGERIMNGDTISNHIDVKTSDSRGTHTMVVDSQMSYVGADCQGLKALDQK